MMKISYIKSPIISVIMPVYNADEYLSASIESILNQTYKNFEFIIINDGSTDNSEKIICSYNDKRIKYIKYDSNLGYVARLNYGLSIASGTFIARMDADDISKPERLEKQLNFLNLNPSIALVGSCYEKIKDNINLGFKKQQQKPYQLKFRLLFGSNIAHPTVMFRRELIDLNRYFYKSEFSPAEDYELWTRLVMEFELYNMPISLLYYRIHSNQISKTKSKIQRENFRRAHASYVKSLLKISNEVFLNEVITFLLSPKQLSYPKRIKLASKIFIATLKTDVDKLYCFIRVFYWAICR